jgi:uncharacterized oligopeptide transporter (OPT) family protein
MSSDNTQGGTPLPIDWQAPQLTTRALLTGMLLGGTLSICNVYAGLKIGWGLNMSITGILLSFAFWAALNKATLGRISPFGKLENNVNQAACSAAASVSSAGLVSAVPALTLINGTVLPYWQLVLWVATVCFVGIAVAMGLRRQMVIVDKLPFPGGISCAATLNEIYGKGSEATRRVLMLIAGAIVASIIKILELSKVIKSTDLHSQFGFTVGGVAPSKYTWSFDPTLMMMSVGALIGFRAAASLLLGAVLAYSVLGPWLVETRRAPLIASEQLLRLPEGVSLPPGSDLEYQAQRGNLRHRGEMSLAQREQYQALSNDPAFDATIDKLWLESQVLPPGTKPPAGAATATTPVTTDTIVAYRAITSSVPLDAWAKDITFPVADVNTLRYDTKAKRLISRGVLQDSTAQALSASITALEAKLSADPTSTRSTTLLPVLTQMRAAIAALSTRSRAVAIPAIPPELTSRVSYDALNSRLIVTGTLAPDQVQLLRSAAGSLPANDKLDWERTASEVASAASVGMVGPNRGDLNEWLLWPGVTLMVVSSLVSFSFSFPSVMRSFRRTKDASAPAEDTGEVSKQWFFFSLILATILAVALQTWLFDIVWWAAVLAVLLSFALAIVACRVSGETNVTPVGAMGKVTQLAFAGLMPSNAAANLTSASITAGAASQAADLMHDLKCGYLLGAIARKQVFGQLLGAMAGSVVGCLFYIILIPNPKEMLLTDEWPAPAVAQWKAVAELFMRGFDSLPPGVVEAMIVSAAVAIVLPVLDKVSPKTVKPYIPSAAALGLAFVIPASNSLSMFIGATIAVIITKLFPRWSDRFLITLAAGIVAGESLTGAGDALRLILFP